MYETMVEALTGETMSERASRAAGAAVADKAPMKAHRAVAIKERNIGKECGVRTEGNKEMV